MDAPVDRLALILAWIERNLHEPLTLETIAKEAGLSPYHLSRMFTARSGRSLMAHLRGRRLVKAAQRLIDEPELRLLDLAIDSGFESQEAFARAFRRTFGVAPSRFRQGFALTPIEGQFPMNLPETAEPRVEQLPQLAQRDAFQVAGVARGFTEANKSEIPQLWARLMGALPLEGQMESWDSYGVVWAVNRRDGSFRYLAGVGVKPDAALPEGFERKAIPAATYAVFRITLTGGAIHLQMKAAMTKIWCELIPASGLELADGPDFEVYDSRFAPQQAGAVIDFHVPVKA